MAEGLPDTSEFDRALQPIQDRLNISFLSYLVSATIYHSRFKIGYKFIFLIDREADTQVPDKQCHCGIFSQVVMLLMHILIKIIGLKRGSQMGNGHAMKNQVVKKYIMIKPKSGNILGRNTGISKVLIVCCAHLAMIRSMEFLSTS